MTASPPWNASCDVARRLLPLYLDRECPADDVGAIERHLIACSECSEEAARERAFRATLREACRADAPPSDLRDRVRGALRRGGSAWGHSTGVAGALAIAATLAAVVLVPSPLDPASRWRTARDKAHHSSRHAAAAATASRAQPPNLNAHAIAERHAQATPLDVASPDLRTVKDALEPHLSFPLRTSPIRSVGAQLLGGRVAELPTSRAAELLYHKDGRKVTLLVAPDTDPVPPARVVPAIGGAAARPTFGVENAGNVNLLHWRRAGSRYTLAADLKPEDLVRLVGAGLDDE